MIEERLKGKAPARSSNSPSTDLEGESAPRLGSPQPIDEGKTPQLNTTPKAPRHLEDLEVASTSEHTAALDSYAPFPLPPFPPLPPPNVAPGLVQSRRTSRPSSQTPSGSRQSQPPFAPGGSHLGRHTGKRNRDPPEGPDLAGSAPKRMKLNALDELEEDPASFQRTIPGVDALQGGLATPRNPPPASASPTPGVALASRLGYPFDRGSPSPQQQQPSRKLSTGNLVPSPPETTSLSTQLITPLVGGAIRRTPEPTSSRAGPNHMVASGTLASAVGGIFNPPSTSTPARPGPSSLLMRTPSTSSRLARGPRPYEHPALINATAPSPSPPPPVISTVGPTTEGYDSGGSWNSNSTNSGGAGGANQAPAPEHVETVTEPPTPNCATFRPVHGMPLIPGAQPLGTVDPFQFPGAIQRHGGRANPRTPTTPDSSVRQSAPETPMASPTRYGTEINPSMRHLY